MIPWHVTKVFLLWASMGLTANGELSVTWSYQSGGTSNDEAYGFAVDPSTKDMVLAGYTEGSVHGNTLTGYKDWVALKLDKDGALLWTFQFGEASSYSTVNAVAIDGSSNVVLVGTHQGSLLGVSAGERDIAVVMLNSAGVQQWSYQTGSTLWDAAQCVAIDSSGNVIVGGWGRGAISGHTFQGGACDSVLLKLDSAGSEQWVLQTTLSTSGDDYIRGVTTDFSDNIYVTGDVGAAFDGNTHYGGRDVFVLKTNSAGTFQWSYQTGTTSTDAGKSIQLNLDGDVIVGGTTYGSLPGNTNAGTGIDSFILKLSAAGSEQWLIQIGTATDTGETLQGLTVHPSSGNFAIYGTHTGDFNGDTNAGGNDWWAVEYDTSGSLQWSYQYGTSSGGETFWGGAYDADGDLVLAGDALSSFYSNTHLGMYDMVAAKFSLPTSTITSTGTVTSITTSLTTATVSSSSTSSTSTSSTTSTSTTSSSTTTTGSSTSTSSTSTSTSTSTTATVSSTTTTSTTTSTATTTSTTVTLSSTTTTSSSTSTTSTSTASTSSSTSTSTTTTTSSTTTSSTTSSTSTSTSITSTTSSTSATSSSTTISSTTSTTLTTSSTSETRTSSTATGITATSTSSSSSSMSTTSSTLTATTTFAKISAAEARTLEAERRQEAAEAVARVRSSEESAVVNALPLLNLTSSNGTTTPQPNGPPEVTEVTIATDLGPVKVARLQVRDLETRTRRILVPGGTTMAMAEVMVAAGTVAEILATAGVDSREPLLLSAVALPSSESSSLETDAVVGNAAVLSSESVSINFWRADGSRVEVKDLVNPLHFTLEVSDPAARCAFWNEDTAKWSEDGTVTVSANATLECSTSHLTIFGGIKDVFLKNIVLALTCSTISTLLSGSAFAKLQDTSWLSSTPSILNMLFHVCGMICFILAWLYDCKQERIIPQEERELILMQVKKMEEKEETEEEAEEDDDAPKPSRWTRCMGCFNQCLEYVSYASGGDATLEAFKELASNADTAAVNRAIANIQSHKSGIARAQISIFNQHDAKNLVPNGMRPTITKATTVSAFALDSEDHGQAAAEEFLQRGWLCRIATLWPASHPWIKAMHFSILAPVRVNVALLFLKITSAGALGAVFYSSSSPSPGSDPECFPKGGVEKAVQSFTVGLVTTMLGDVIISILFALQVKRVVFSPHKWSEAEKRRQHVLWSIWSAVFWIIFLIYGGCCELYIFLFLANVMEADANSWLQSMGVSLLEGLLLKSLLTAFALGTIATLVLCCRPHVTQKVTARWIKDADAADASDSDAEPQQNGEVTRGTKSFQALEVREAGQVTSVKHQDDSFLGVLPGAVMDSSGQDGQDGQD